MAERTDHDPMDPQQPGTQTPTLSPPTMHDDVEDILLTEEQIRQRVAELGQQLAADYVGRFPVLVSVLKGSIIFLADLVRSMPVPLSVDLMELSSYGASTESSGQVRILKDLSGPISGRDIVVVEDIIVTGLTLNYLLHYLRDRNPSSITVCCLLDKPARRLAEIQIDYRGFTIPDRFVIGYGLDYDERYRNLPYIAEYAGPEAV
jgi:hypoxanthine phosphoribosyltransferase